MSEAIAANRGEPVEVRSDSPREAVQRSGGALGGSVGSSG